MAVQPDKRIVVGGRAGDTTTGDFAVARFAADGVREPRRDDRAIGLDDDVVVDDLGGPDHFFNIALQNDGSVVVGTAHGDFLIARYTSDGCPDLTSGTGGSGRTTTDLFGRNDLAFDLAIRPDGAIVVGGEEGAVDAFGVTSSAFAVAQYRADGKLDSTFAGRGFTTSDIVPGSADGIRGIELEGTSVLAVGFAGERHGLTSFLDPTEGDFALARYTSAGDLGTTYGSGDGVVTTDFSGQGDGIRAVVVVSGKVVVAGGANGPVDLDIALARYLL